MALSAERSRCRRQCHRVCRRRPQGRAHRRRARARHDDSPAVEYIVACAKRDGSFRYQADGGHATFQLTAAAVTALFAAGAYDGPEIRGALDYLLNFRADRSKPILGHFFYGHYYAIQAAYHARGDYFRGWYEPLRDKLVRDQDPTGRWRRSTVGDIYATAMAVLILAIPNHHLPIFVR